MLRRALLPPAVLMLAWLVYPPRRHDPLAAFPRVVLWAWERPEDLAFADPSCAGVAFLAQTVTMGGGRVRSRPRLQPLRLPPGMAVMAVVRTIRWARAHPEDPRVPEALHLAVRTSRYGVTDAKTGEYSQRAFQFLKTRYADTKWARETKYWYR